MMQNADLVGLFRETVDELTAGATAPAGLTDRVMRRHRRRRLTIRAGGAAAAAAGAAAAGLVTAGLTGAAGPAGHPGSQPVQTAAYVVGRAERAMTASQGRDILDLSIVTTPHGGAVASAGPVLIRSYGRRIRWDVLAADGQPQLVTWDAIESRQLTQVVLDYQRRTWQQTSEVGGPARTYPRTGCQVLPTTVVDWYTQDWPGWIRWALRCGQLRIAGRQRVGGTEAIRLVQARPGASVRWTIWVSSASYRPVRIVVQTGTPSGPNAVMRSDVRYLRPTPARLALLRPVIPPGFRRVPPQ